MGMNPSAYYDSYDMKSDEGWDELVELIRTIEFDFNNLQSILNVDRVLWAFAANQVLLNLDCYNTYYIHNFYLYQTEDGLFQMIPWDLDNSFTGGIMGWNYWSPANVYEFEPYILGPPLGGSTPAWEQRPLLNKILENDINTVEWKELNPTSPFYLFIPQNTDCKAEYETGWKITDIMPVHSTGVKSHRDHFVFDFDDAELYKRIENFKNLSLSDQEIIERYDISDTCDWKIGERRKSLGMRIK